MADLSQVPHVAHVVPHVKHVVHATAPVIFQGYTLLTLLISNAVSAAVAGGAAWYVRGRGMAGVQIDLNNVKTDIENLKAKLSPAVVTPVAA